MIVIDIETTSLNPESIVSAGALEYENHRNVFYEECRVLEGMPITDVALSINGFTVTQITDPKKQTLEDLMHHFVDWAYRIPNVTLAGENVGSFDMRGVQSALARFKIEDRLDTGRLICILYA